MEIRVKDIVYYAAGFVLAGNLCIFLLKMPVLGMVLNAIGVLLFIPRLYYHFKGKKMREAD